VRCVLPVACRPPCRPNAACICWRVGGTRDIPVEALFPQHREGFELGASGWSRVLGIDAVGPDWRGITLAGVILDLAGEVGDELGSLGQVVAPDGMVLRRGWNAREPGQRTWVGRRELWEAPVKDGGHVAGSAEVSPEGGCQHVKERVFTGFGPQSAPGVWHIGF
jgi:hypothetical protein